jgi:hypothetical protein
MSKYDELKAQLEKTLAELKPFQRRSVEHIFERMYGNNPTRRFLLADEVGLGKTMVARGVIARAIDRLRNEVEHFNVVYICSNQDIARQNISRLNTTGREDVVMTSRITLLPLEKRKPSTGHRSTFYSFTPGTSFDLKSKSGVRKERAMLCVLLKEAWDLRGKAYLNVLQGRSDSDRFRDEVGEISLDELDNRLHADFCKAARADKNLRQDFESLLGDFSRRKQPGDFITDEVTERRREVTGRLRDLLAKVCLRSLEPHLIVLDEFQRFKHLLSDSSDDGQLANDLFRFAENRSSGARVLLLSATPYKMYTRSGEDAGDDHYTDFLQTVKFLINDDERTKEVEGLLKRYRESMFCLGEGTVAEVLRVRDELQDRLAQVMCRTERLAVDPGRNGMLRTVPAELELHAGDVTAYPRLQEVARAVGHHDTIEYWKSAPYLLSFMDESYSLKRAVGSGAAFEALCGVLGRAGGRDALALPTEDLRRYRAIDERNPRLRSLTRQTLGDGAWKALWLAPSLPYYRPSGAFDGLRLTKRLVFSCWQVVPRAVATLLSYEAERQMVGLFDSEASNTAAARKKHKPLLALSKSDERLSGMPVLGLMYPSTFLARHCDPVRWRVDAASGGLPSREETLRRAQDFIRGRLAGIVEGQRDTGPEDERWYWAAPILLDAEEDSEGSKAWWEHEGLAEAWAGTVREAGGA